MASKIKGITVEIGGDTTKLGKALQGVETKTKSLQTELKGVNTLLKTDPSNVTLLAQKQELLNSVIGETKDKLETLKTAQAQVQAQFDKGEITEEQYRDFQREIIVTEQKLESLTGQLKEFGSVGAQQVAQVGEKMQDVGGKVENAGKKVSVLSAGAGAVLAGSVAAFTELDSGYDTIITKTGATGDALEELNSVADNIFGSMPTDMDTVGIAVGEINTRFGYTGEKLEGLSRQFIEFAEINGVDLNNSIGTVDKVLEQFNMSGDEAGGVLDLITKKAQETGIGADTLMDSIQNNGATFKDMGIGVNEAVVMMSQFEANGVNVEIALKGLKKSTVEYAKEGLSMEEGLSKTINSIKNAKTETEALAEVEKLFGAKGANEMVKAIREGRFNVEDLSASMSDYSGTVSDTFNATLDPIDDSKVAMNNLKLAGSELGGVLQSTFAPMLTALVEKLKALATWFSNLSPGMQKTIVVVLSVITALGPLIIIIGKLISSVGTIMTFAPKLVTAFKAVGTAFKTLGTAFMSNPIFLVIAGVVALIAIFVTLYQKCEWFRNGVNAIWDGIKAGFTAVIDWFKSIPEKVKALFSKIVNFVKENWQALLLMLVNPFAGAFKLLYDNSEGFRNIVNKIVNFFKALPGEIWTAILGAVDKIKQWGVNVKNKAVEVTTNVINSVVNFFKQLPYKIGYAIGFVIGTLVKWASNVKSWVTTEVPKIITKVINFFKQLPGKIWNAIVSAVTKIAQWGANMKAKAVSAVTTLVSNVVSFMKQLPGKIWSAIVSAVTRVGTWASNMKNKAVSGVKSLVSSVVNFFKQLPGKIKSAISSAISAIGTWCSNMKTKAVNGIKNVVSAVTNGFKSLPSKMLSIGKNIVEGVWNGIKNATSWIKNKVKSFAKGILDGIKGALGIKSPSRVFRDEVGKFIAEGIGVGITDNSDSPLGALKELGDDMSAQTFDINGATIERKLSATFGVNNGNALTNGSLLSKLDGIYERLGRLQMVLDSGTLIGEIIDGIDAGLADRQLLKERGV